MFGGQPFRGNVLRRQLFRGQFAAELDADARPSQVTDRIGVARRLAVELKTCVNQVGIEEFYGQEAQFDEDSRLGRELLYLASNDEWIRATREIVTFESADMLDTRIQVHVDLDRITHEAFRDRDERIWLPLVVLAPPRVDEERPQPQHVRPTPTVLDSAGNVVPSLPESEARRWVAAAMAEIVLNMIPPAVGGDFGTLAREQRLLLSAAMYRVLRDGDHAGLPGQPETPARPGLLGQPGIPGRGAAMEDGERLRRVQRARTRLCDLFDWIGRHLENPTRAGGTQRDGLMIRRAAHVLHAVRSPTTLVVVAHQPTTESAVFSVDLPGRPLIAEHGTGRWRRPHGPTARADVDILLPGMDAEHAVEVNLPEGVSLAHRQQARGSAPLNAIVRVDRPRCLRHIDDLMSQLVPQPGEEHEDPVAQCLVDFTLARIDVAIDAFRHYRSADSGTVEGLPGWLSGLRSGLRAVGSGGAAAEGGRDAVLAQRVSGARPDEERLYRMVAGDSRSPRRGHVWLPAVENRNVRATPITARFGLEVVADGSAPLRAARYSGFLSLVLLFAVLVGVLVEKHPGQKLYVDGQVLGSVLTLFAAIQASRISPPDRSVLRGLLIASHTWVIVASILPAVLLGVVLAFYDGTAPWQAVLVAFAAQLLLQAAMYSPWLTGRRSRSSRDGLVLSTGVALDYPRVDVLRASWWRSTTAGALLLGANAHGYVVPQDDGTVLHLLTHANRLTTRVQRERGVLRGRGLGPTRAGDPAAARPANILAMLRAGTAARTLSFVVFREQPADEWQAASRVKIELDVDRLIVHEAPVGNVDLYLGMEPGHFPELRGHPIMRLLDVAAERELLVLDVQQPVPPPHGGDPRRLWSRTRIGLRGDEVRNLAGLLTESLAAVRRATGPSVDLLVDMSTQTPPRCFLGQTGVVPAHPLVPTDLDVVRLAGAPRASGGSSNGSSSTTGSTRWFSTVLTDYALAGTERDLLARLAVLHPRLRLSGLTAARLHGVAVLLVLAHQSGEAGSSTLALDGVNAPVARWSGSGELGQLPAGGTLLQVHARYSDRPGVFASLVEAIGTGLGRATGVPYEPGTLHVTYLQTEVADGRNAVVKFMVRLPAPVTARGLHPAIVQRVEQAARQVLVAQAHAAAGPDDLGLMRVPRAMVRIVVLGAEALPPHEIDLRTERIMRSG